MDLFGLILHTAIFLVFCKLSCCWSLHTHWQKGNLHTSANWLAVADGISGWRSLLLLPYSFIFIVMSILANYVFLVPCGTDWLWFWALNLLALLSHTLRRRWRFFCSLFPCVEYYYCIVSMVGLLGATLEKYLPVFCLHRCVLCLYLSRPSLCRDWTESAFMATMVMRMWGNVAVCCCSLFLLCCCCYPILETLFNQSEIVTILNNILAVSLARVSWCVPAIPFYWYQRWHLVWITL